MVPKRKPKVINKIDDLDAVIKKFYYSNREVNVDTELQLKVKVKKNPIGNGIQEFYQRDYLSKSEVASNEHYIPIATEPIVVDRGDTNETELEEWGLQNCETALTNLGIEYHREGLTVVTGSQQTEIKLKDQHL
jgi:hypothetical protein